FTLPFPPVPLYPLSPFSPAFDSQFPILQTAIASLPLSKKQIVLLKETFLRFYCSTSKKFPFACKLSLFRKAATYPSYLIKKSKSAPPDHLNKSLKPPPLNPLPTLPEKTIPPEKENRIPTITENASKPFSQKTFLPPPSLPEKPLESLQIAFEPDHSVIQTDLPDPTSEFETDLQEILSYSHTKPSTDSIMTDLVIYSPPTLPLTSPVPTSFLATSFSTSSPEFQFVVALAANQSYKRRKTLFKHKPSSKIPLLPYTLSITTINHFSALDPDHPDTQLYNSSSAVEGSLESSAPLSSATPFEGPLFTQ
ncbi:hypothetical protein IGI04_030573, partial [Brassica rapa subsp. trilocularis]